MMLEPCLQICRASVYCMIPLASDYYQPELRLSLQRYSHIYGDPTARLPIKVV